MNPFLYLQSKWVYGYGLALDALKGLGLREGSLLLLLGSGLGKTALLAAKRFGCIVLGAELFPQMVRRAELRAEAQGLSDRVRFLLLDPRQPYLEVKADAILFESLLSYLQDPLGVLRFYAGMLRADGRLGALELTLLRSGVRGLGEFFGEATFRDAQGWWELMEGAGLRRLGFKLVGLSLSRKLWDDLRAAPLGTLLDLSKTLYKAYTDAQAKASLKLFRRFFRERGKELACGLYLATALPSAQLSRAPLPSLK